ncbi:MAG: GNAT family N-acetyltransferase [Chitinophagaceae bacterium]
MFQEVSLRLWQSTDAQRLCELGNNPNIAANMRDAFPSPYTLTDALGFINKTIEDEHFKHVRAIVWNEEVVGSIGIFQEHDIYRFNYEIGYWLGEAYWGKGIMKEALRLMINYAETETDAHRLYAGVFDYNVASANVLRRNGFKEVALLQDKVFKNGRFIHEYLFEILI